MKILLILLLVISCIDTFVLYCAVVVGKQSDERMNSMMDWGEE